MPKNNDDRQVTFEIVEEIGIISTSGTGWQKELNIVAWNGNQGKYDIREWSPHHDRMSRGITLNEQEMRTIVDLLKRRVRYVPRGRVTISQESEADVQEAAGLQTQDDTGLQTQDAAEEDTINAADPLLQERSEAAPQQSEESLLQQAGESVLQDDNTFIPGAMEEARQKEAAF